MYHYSNFLQHRDYTRTMIIFTCFLTFLELSKCQDMVDNGLIISQLPNFFSSGSLTTLPGSIDKFKTTSIFPVRNFNFHQTTEIVSIATDANDRKIYLLDGNTRSLYKMDNFNVWLNDSSQSISLLHEGISKTSSKLAYDWLTKNIYWTDEFYNWIAVQSTNSSDSSMFRVLIQSGLTKPLAIALDPFKGYLFWAEHDETGKIERTTLAGEDRKIIVTGTVWVPDMTVDTEKQTIYWIDIQRNTVEKSDYDGKNRKVIRRSKFTTISMSGITVYKNLVCVTEYHSYLVTCLDKTTGDNQWMRYFRSKTPWAISVYDKDTQKIVSHKCESMKCAHFCVNTPKGGKCMCKSGYQLTEDKINCKAEHNLFSKGLFISNKTDVCMLDIRVITSLSHEPICILSGRHSIKYLTTSARDQHLLFFTDNHYLFSFNLRINVTTKLTRVGKISGLAYDWIERNVYWTEKDTGSLNVWSLATRAATELITDLDDPSYLTLCPYHKKLYWKSKTTDASKIMSATFDGSQVSTLVGRKSPAAINGLSYNVEASRLFWIDDGILTSVKYDGSDSKKYYSLRTDTELVVYKDYSLSTTSENELHSAFLGARGIDLTVELDGFGKLTGMAVYDPALQRKRKGPCDFNNGGCEHICVPNGVFRTCLCSFGFHLDINGANCSSNIMEDNFVLTVDFTHKKMYQISLYTAEVSALDTDESYSPARAVIHHLTSEIFWSDYRSRQIRKMTMNGKNSTVLLNLGSFTPFGLAIDYSTDLVYYAAILSGVHNSSSFIGVFDPYNGIDKPIISGLTAAYEIVLYPEGGYLFFTDTGDVPYIGRANMDGSDIKPIVATGIRQVNGLSIDYREKKIYWTDGVKDVIEYCDFDGGKRKVLREDEQAHLANLVVSGKYVYYTAINRQRITKVDKRTGYKVHWMDDAFQYGRLESVDTHPGDIQPVNMECSIGNGRCSSLCLPTPNGPTCACEERYYLKKDGHTCSGGEKRKPLHYLRRMSVSPEWNKNAHQGPTKHPSKLTSEPDTNLTPIIAGSVVGGIVVFAAIAVLIFFFIRKRKGSSYEEQIDTPNVRFANEQGITNMGWTEDSASPKKS